METTDANAPLDISYVKNPDGAVNESLIPDEPVAIYALSEGTRLKLRDDIGGAGEGEPYEAIMLAEPKGEDSMQQRISAALSASAYKVMRERADFPKVTVKKELGGGSFKLIEKAPLFFAQLSGLQVSDKISGRTIPVDGVLLCKDPGATEAEYTQARNLIVKEANDMLRLFDAEFRIPNFPPMENRRTI